MSFELLKISEVKVPVTAARDYTAIVAEKLGINENKILSCKIARKSIDARKKGNVYYVYTFLAEVENEAVILKKGIRNV